MDRLRKTFALLCIAALPAVAAPLLQSSPDLCFTAGSVTYRLTSDVPAADFRVAIDNAAARPDLRVRLVDRVETADFALTDDAGSTSGRACHAAGAVKTVATVPAGAPADITIAVARQNVTDAKTDNTSDAKLDGAGADFALFVHSARVGHFDAAALFALIRRETARNGGRIAANR